MKCPDCDGVVNQKDCWNCNGAGYNDEDGYEVECEICEGSGFLSGEYECIDCAHEWEEKLGKSK